MEKFLLALAWIVVTVDFVYFVQGNPLTPLLQQSKNPCGGWTFFSENKCIKIIDTGFQVQNYAELACQESDNPEAFPRLLTIKSKEELDFARKFLFEEHNIPDHVWLGLKSSDGEDFRWNDGSELGFSNWAEQNSSDNDRHCVQMESGRGANVAAGQWVMVTCRKNNVVVCEKPPMLTLEGLQDKLSKAKSNLERIINNLLMNLTLAEREIVDLKSGRDESERNIISLNKKHEATEDEIDTIKRKTDASAKEIVDLFQKNQAALQEIKVISLEREKANSELVSLKNRNDDLENQINLMQQRNNASEVEMIDVKQEAERQANIMQHMEKEIKYLKQGNEASNKEIALVKQKASRAEEQVNKITKNPVPVGYIYVQLPGQKAPTLLWEGTKWEDVSEKHDSLFFRVAGKNTAPFGKVQEQNTVHLLQVQQKYKNHDDKAPYLPLDGSWSRDVVTGSDNDKSYMGLQFRLSTGEVRPKNEAVRIWQRVE